MSISTETPATEIARALEDFLAEHSQAAVLEDGRVIFDMRTAHYSLTTERDRCLLHLWSNERNLVRTVSGIELRKGVLRIATRRFGQPLPQTLELVSDRDRRSSSTREAARLRHQRLLERVLLRAFPGWLLDGFRVATDLENSFGPAYTRGILQRGNVAWAVIAVNAEETQSTIDGILTVGILWLAHCREHGEGRRLFEGLKIVVPSGASPVVQARMAWLDEAVAKWELYELDERCEELVPVDVRSYGNLSARLVHAFDPNAALERCRITVNSFLERLPPGMRAVMEICPRTPTEIAFLLHGLEFARVRHGLVAGSFARQDAITFGAGANETSLNDETAELFSDMVQRLFENRIASGTKRNPLFRLQPERWLESVLRRDLPEIEPSLRTEILYSQVPAFAYGDRAILDLLTVTRAGRLAVIELKADDDLHLPVQALDYWARVLQLQREDAFRRHGYFQGIELSDQPPLLYLVAPALRVHPSTDIVLKHFSPRVPWELIGINEDWRKRRKVIFRKRPRSS